MTDDRETRAAEYVLGLLSGEEMEAFERLLSGDDELQAEVEQWREEFSALDGEYAEVSPKRHIWPDVEKRIKAEAGIANDNAGGGVPDTLFRWKLATFASLAAAIILAAIVFMRSPETQREYLAPTDQPALVAQLQGDIEGLLLTASYSPDNGEMKVDVDGMPVTETEPEIWVRKPDNSVVSLGQIGRDGISSMKVPDDIRQYLSDGAILILTMEPPSETPHAAPSGDAVATGRATLIS